VVFSEKAKGDRPELDLIDPALAPYQVLGAPRLPT
jgi:hypothetical protein